MECCDRAEVWRQPLFLRPTQLELFGRAGQGASSAEAGVCPVGTSDDSGAIGRLLRDVYPRVRGAVICMTTAAHLHDLLPGLPTPLWLGVPLRVHVPRWGRTELRVLRWSNRPAFELGVEVAEFCDVTLLRTSRERTIVDLLRYGRHLGGAATAARCLRVYSATGGRETDVRNMARLVLDALLGGIGAAP